MRAAACLALAAAVLAAGARASAEPPTAPSVVIEFTDPGISPPHWVMTLHPDGSGHFHSEAGAPPPGGLREIDAPSVTRDFTVSHKFAQDVFAVAAHHAWFNQKCDSHLKVAFQGWKKLSYSGPNGQGSCTFNYSKDKDIEDLGDSLEAVAETVIEGERLELLLEHDPLGLDKEIEVLVEAVEDGRAQQVCAIRGILERLAQDDNVLVMVRKRARMLLAQAQT